MSIMQFVVVLFSQVVVFRIKILVMEFLVISVYHAVIKLAIFRGRYTPICDRHEVPIFIL